MSWVALDAFGLSVYLNTNPEFCAAATRFFELQKMVIDAA
jgi:hypothetical protein